ncbi:MAG: hypothetical protein IJT78_02365 [Oscillospiraceae bacterium]|nr:hypothetical protein [Oscillospiraceae bacterium]
MDKMEFVLGNPQEEKPRRVQKKPRGKKWWILILLAVLALGAVLAAVLWDANSFDGLRRSFLYARAEKDESGCARLYDYAADRNSRFAALEGSLLIASPSQIRLVGADGELRYEESIRFGECSVSVTSDAAAVYEVGGTELYVVGSRGLLYHTVSQGEILSAELSETGYLALTANGTGCKAEVTVYDPAGEAVFSYRSADRFLMTAAISRDGRTVTAVALDQADGVFCSELVTYRLNSAEPCGTCRITGGAVVDAGAVGHSLCAVAEDGLHLVDKDGSLRGTFSFDGDSLRRCELQGDGYAALLLGHYRSSSQCRLVTVNDDGELLASLEVDSDVLDLSAAGRYIAVLYSDHMTIYDKLLNECSVLQEVSAAKAVMVRSDGSAILAGMTAASLYLP